MKDIMIVLWEFVLDGVLLLAHALNGMVGV